MAFFVNRESQKIPPSSDPPMPARGKAIEDYDGIG